MCAAIFNDNELDQLLNEVFEQWDIAERRIKRAEQVRANEVVASAIFELRYAGRKLVDAFKLAGTADWQNDPDARRAIHAYLADAKEDCVKAKHDAIDSMLDFVTRWFHDTEERIGLKGLTNFFPNYVDITGSISIIQEQIADSRANRHMRRDEVYNAVEEKDLDEILKLYSTMRASKDRVALVVEQENSRENTLRWAGISGPIIALIAIVVAVVIA